MQPDDYDNYFKALVSSKLLQVAKDNGQTINKLVKEVLD